MIEQGGRGIASMAVATCGLLAGLFVISSVLSGQGNAIGALYRYLLVGGFFMGAVAPRVAFVGLILMCGYIDVLKKAMVAGDYLTFIDLFFVLGIPPVTFLGICVNIVIALVLGRIPSTTRNFSFILLAVLIIIFLGGLGVARVGVSLGTLKLLANSASYFALIFVLPILYPKAEEIMRMIWIIILAMVPAALHGLYHYQFGLMDFEEQYMLSGLSVNLFFMLRGEGIFGPFSSQGTLSATMSMCVVLALIPLFAPRAFWGLKAGWSRWLGISLAVLFLVAAIFSLKRGPILVIPGAIFAFIVLGRRWMTIAMYVIAPLSLVVLVINASDIARKLPEWQDSIYNAINLGSANKLTQVRTLNARLEDFALLADLDNWTPFGSEIVQEESYGTHAGLVGIVVRYGWVPLLVLAGILVPVLYRFHQRVLFDKESPEGFLTRFGAAMGLAMFGATAMGFGSATAFPNSFFIAFFFAIFVGFAYFREGRYSEILELGSDRNIGGVAEPTPLVRR